MDYKKIYDNLILKAQNRIIDDGIYVEKHHIIPKCIDKTKIKDKNNIVKLLGREHFIAHLLLFKIYNLDNRLLSAIWLMCNVKNKQYKVNNKIYEIIRKKHSEKMKNRIISQITRLKMGLSQKGKKLSEEQKAIISKIQKGKKHMLGKKWSKQSRENFSAKLKKEGRSKGNKNPMYGKSAIKNLTWVSKGNSNKYINKKELDFYLNNQWVKGRENKKGNKNPNVKTYILYSPCGIKHIVRSNLKDFCDNQAVPFDGLRKKVGKENNKYKNWSIYKE
jgi:hypothetical protein